MTTVLEYVLQILGGVVISGAFIVAFTMVFATWCLRKYTEPAPKPIPIIILMTVAGICMVLYWIGCIPLIRELLMVGTAVILTTFICLVLNQREWYRDFFDSMKKGNR